MSTEAVEQSTGAEKVAHPLQAVFDTAVNIAGQYGQQLEGMDSVEPEYGRVQWKTQEFQHKTEFLQSIFLVQEAESTTDLAYQYLFSRFPDEQVKTKWQLLKNVDPDLSFRDLVEALLVELASSAKQSKDYPSALAQIFDRLDQAMQGAFKIETDPKDKANLKNRIRHIIEIREKYSPIIDNPSAVYLAQERLLRLAVEDNPAHRSSLQHQLSS